MKSCASKSSWYRSLASHPTRGAWIEIFSVDRPHPMLCGRTPHGVRGLKFTPLA